MKNIKWIDKDDIQEVLKTYDRPEERASIIYGKIRNYERRATDGIVTMPCTMQDLVEYIENFDKGVNNG